MTDMEKPKYWDRNLSQCHFVHHKSHTDRPGIEPWPPWQKVKDESPVPMARLVVAVIVITGTIIC
jgi:hypothetical protein